MASIRHGTDAMTLRWLTPPFDAAPNIRTFFYKTSERKLLTPTTDAAPIILPLPVICATSLLGKQDLLGETSIVM